MSILSIMTPADLSVAICTENTKSIAKASGIGAKTAARIILELKDKLMKSSIGISDSIPATPTNAKGVSGATNRSKISEAQDALTVLGYNRMPRVPRSTTQQGGITLSHLG
jgi:Holliday junction DNA helicase RuvA